jgi:hypothetical protein
MAVVSGTREHRHPGRHFLVRASEAELICGAIRQLASGPLAEATIAALRAAGREAEAGGSGGTFSFRAPDHAEHLVIRAAIRAHGRLLVRP